MKLIIDANILIAGILGSKRSIAILTSGQHTIFAPERIVKEITKYKEELRKKADLSSDAFDERLRALLAYITIVTFQDYHSFYSSASEALTRDPNDADYLACALVMQADRIWTNDKDFTSQKLVRTITTKELQLEST